MQKKLHLLCAKVNRAVQHCALDLKAHNSSSQENRKKVNLFYLRIQIFQDNQIFFDIIISRPFGVVTSRYIDDFGVFAAIETDNGFTPHEIGHVMEDLNGEKRLRETE